MAAERGWTVVGEYADNDISAYSGKIRPEYERLQDSMRAGDVDVVVAWATDRLFRRSRQLEDWIDLCEETGIGIHSVTAGTVDLSTPTGRAVARAMTAFASLEVDMLTLRVQRKHEELAESGAWPGARVYGYAKDSAVIPEEAEIIREMADRVLAGEGFNEIARDLNRRGVKTTRGAQWRAATIVGILRAPRLAGLRVHQGRIASKGTWEPILSEELSAVLRARLAPGRSQGTRGGRRKHLLVGILKCGRCGTGMVRGLGGKTKTPNYRCPKNQGAAACGRMTVVADKIETWVSEQAFHTVHLAAGKPAPDEGEWLQRTKELAARREQLGADYAEGLIDRETMLAGTKAIRAQEAQLQPPTARKPKLQVSEDRLRAAWPHMTTSEQRSVLETLIERITVNPVLITTGAKKFDPRRFEIEWKV